MPQRSRSRSRTPGYAVGFPMSADGILATLDFDFANGRYYQSGQGIDPLVLTTTARASSGTNLLSTSVSGFAYATFSNNVPRITAGSGLLIEESRVNRLLNSAAPVTQTTASLATGTYTLWVNGAGTATSSAGTAVGTGFGVASQGAPNTIVITSAGTVVVTVAGALNAFQLELGAFGTSLIVTAGVVGTRASDVVTITTPPTFTSAYSMAPSGIPHAPLTAAAQFLAEIDDGSGNNRIALVKASTTGFVRALMISGGASQFDHQIDNKFWVVGGIGKGALAVSAASQNDAFDGVSNDGTANTIPIDVTTVRLGSNQTPAAFWNGYIARFVLWHSTRISDAALRRITTP